VTGAVLGWVDSQSPGAAHRFGPACRGRRAASRWSGDRKSGQESKSCVLAAAQQGGH
jgi:hypothetical protein